MYRLRVGVERAESSTLTARISNPVDVDIVTVAFTLKLLRLVTMLSEAFRSE